MKKDKSIGKVFTQNMKVFFFINIIPPDYGGGYLRVFRIASRFKQYGKLYKIATYTKREVYQQDVQGITREDVFFLRGNVLNRWLELPLKMIFHSKEYDVLYIASARWYSVLPTLIAKMQHKKVVNSVTLSMVDSPALKANRLYKRPFYWYKNTQFRLADFVFVNSPLLVEECVNYGLKKERVKLINNPVDTIKYHSVTHEEKKKIRIKLGLPEDQFTVLFVGSFNKRKGCDILPEVFAKVLKEISEPITFVMCGQKGYQETESILSQLTVLFGEVGCNLIIREEVRDTSPYYQAADLFLFPTTNEGMPNVVLEAMASGCMIMCNTLPGITDYILDKNFLVCDNNVWGYVEGIIDYYHNNEKYEGSIMNNRLKIENGYSITAVDSTIMKVLA